jgi:hypothetical protein
MRSLAILTLLAVVTNHLMGQLSFSAYTDKSIYNYSDRIIVTITARNSGNIPDTLTFTTGCQAGYFIDTIIYYHCDSLSGYCTQAFSHRIVPANDSTIWGGSSGWPCYFTGAMIGAGKHSIVAIVPYLPQAWVSDTLWIVVASPTSVRDKTWPLKNYMLGNNYPQPFNPSTTIQFTLPHESHVTLKIYNLLGQEVRTLVNDTRTAGTYNVEFDAAKLTSGIYFYTLQAGRFVQTKKMLVIR